MFRMIGALAAAAALFTGSAAAETNGRPHWSVAIHGGAGVIERKDLSPETEAAYRAALARATEAAASVLDDGGTALDAVEAAIRLMEDDPLFNAGRGAVFTSKGTNELDASIMDGATLRAGAAASVTGVRHPISLARRVMEASPHVMLIGAGAEAFADEQGLERADPAWFFTERRWRSLVQVLTERGDPIPPRPEGAPAPSASAEDAPLDERKFGTVGVVALDVHGNLAAGTSTGGTTGKRWGRVGDAPVIGAGTYASRACAVSATGTGEYFIRLSVARAICALMELRGMSAQAAADQVIGRDLTAIGGDGGVVVMSPSGDAAFSMNTPGMYRASAASDKPVVTAIFSDED